LTHVQDFFRFREADVTLLDPNLMHVEVRATTPGKAKTLALLEVRGAVVKILAVPNDADADRYLVLIDPMRSA